jgi:hypothetical protein
VKLRKLRDHIDIRDIPRMIFSQPELRDNTGNDSGKHDRVYSG